MFRLITLLVTVLTLNLLPAWSHASTLASDLSNSLGESRRVASLALSKSRNGQPASTEMSRLTALRDELAALRLLHAEYGSSVASRASSLGGNALERQQAFTTTLPPVLDDLIVKLDAAIKSGSAEDLQQLLDIINRLSPSRPRPLLGTLPYKHSGYPPREPETSPLVAPAYKGGDRTVHPADTAASAEAPLTREIVELAQSLQWNPVLIYEWVKNNVETEWYWGSMKGAGETLRQKSGNDADQASLLVALLRAANFPARYVRGTIDFFPGIEHAKNLIGLDDPISIADFLRKAGIPFKPVISGGGIANFQIEHIWVEAFIPYANYRGAVLDEQGKLWLGLDTSIKPRGYSRGQGGGVPADMLATLRDDYLKGIQALTPLEYLAAKLDEQLAESQPGKSWSDLRDTAVLIPDVLKIIPDSMQFNQIAITGEYQALPEELKHKLTITATAGGNELFSITQDTRKLSNRRLALRAEPETVEDQNTIDSFGGLDNTPAYLVRLRPVLTLDGEQLIVAQDGLPMGGDFTLNTDIITPNGTERISSSQVNGNLSVIGVVAQLSTKSTNDTKIVDTDDAETILHKEAISYIDSWNRSEDDLAALLGQRITRPTVTIVTVGGQIEVAYLLDSPQDFQWKGLYLDAGYRRIETTGRNGLESDFMRLSSLQGSILENRIFEDDLKVDSVSTAKLLQLASAGGTPIITIDKATIDTILPTLAFDDAVKADIVNAVNQGLTVSMPQMEVAYQDWSGIGYVKENPVTGEAGWMLSGQVAGGMTAWSGERWDSDTLTALYATLKSSSGVKPNTNTQAGVYIIKIPATDQQHGVVGNALAQQLQVKVLDSKMKPVQGASVTFNVRAGGGTLSVKGKTAGTTYVAKTDAIGIASVTLTLGPLTSDNPIYQNTSGKTYSDQYGDNVVEAVLDSTGAYTTFNAYAAPGPLAKLRPTHGMNLQWYFLSYGGFVGLMAEDLNGNPIANQAVTFKLGDTAITGSCKSKIIDITKVTPALLVKAGDNCINSSPTISDAASCSMSSNTINDTTSISGAWAGVILGGAPGATYPVTATATAKGKTFTAQYSPSTFDLINCNDNVDPKAQLVVSSLIPKDIYGNNIDAGRSGSKISIIAKQYLIKEGETTGTENLSCDTGTLTCPKIVGNHSFSTTTDFITSTAKYDGIAANNLGNGLFQALYTLKPGLNTIKIEGTASHGFNHVINTCAGCGVIGKDVRTLSNAGTLQVYGVDISIRQPLNIMLNDQGISRNNLKISYTINPTTYQARDALILLYKVTDQSGKKSYEQIDYIPVEKKRGGFGTIARGYPFDETQSYAASVVLNYGTSAQITSDPAPINFVDGALIPDYNHNRQVDDEDFDRALNNDTYYFWVNDDDGNGDTEGTGIPGSGNLSWNRTNVNGTRDLVDYFPVYIDIAKTKQKYPPSVYSYKLNHETSSLTLVETTLDPGTSGNYLIDMPTVQQLATASKTMITNVGYKLPDSILNGKGVVLLEGWKEATTPLKLIVYDPAGKKMDEKVLNLSIAGVEQMFRHKNLIQSINARNAPPIETGTIGEHHSKGGEKDRLSTVDFANQNHFSGFDDTCDDKYAIWFHGANVSGQDARGWHSEMFKRLYWAGSKARFLGVSWFSFDSQSWDFYPNVVHAFETAKEVGPTLKTILGNAPVTVMAHSLGNMLVSSYLVDYYALQPPTENPNITNYFLLNAAVSLEAFLGDYTNYAEGNLNEAFDDSTASNQMVHSDWFGYQKRFGASEWHQLFGPDDGRSRLTWRKRFAALPSGINYVNFYSGGEDVLASYGGTQPAPSDLISFNLGRNAWVLQEKWKGRPLGLAGSLWMGWGFNLTDDQYNPYLKGHLDASEANLVVGNNNQLILRPFFNNLAPASIESVLFQDMSLDFSTIRPNYNSLMAYAIPALTTATGGWAGGEMISNKNFFVTDMNLKKDNITWPRREQRWNHSDIRDVAFPFVYKIIDELAIKGALQ